MTTGNPGNVTFENLPIDHTFRIVPLGVGDAFSEKYYSSGLWLSSGGYSVIIDCAHPIRKSMREAAISSGCDIRVDNLDAILLTHLHADHSSGLEGIGFYSHYVAHRKLSLLAHEDVMRDVWSWQLKGTMAPMCDPVDEQRTLDDFFNPVIMNSTSATSLGPFEIECRQTVHHIPTFALRIKAGGKTFGYSSDTSFDESLIDWLSESDLFVHEINLGSHTPYEKLVSLPQSVRDKIRLIHYPDGFDCKASIIEPLTQGQLILL